MSRALTLLRTALALGVPSIARVVAYRIGVRLGINPVRRLQATVPQGPFFAPSRPEMPPVAAPPVTGWQDSARLFGCWMADVGSQPPNWLANPLTGLRVPEPERMWWQIPDFDPKVGDIKLIWELSRMDWVLAFAQRARNGDTAALQRLNDWLVDWCRHNPPYRGPNWKCGQEASIRVMHLAMAALILGQTRQTAPALRDLIHLHLQRIAPTLSYAIGQDNNHGTSEAAALFIGGSWLQALGLPVSARWATRGRRWLENRAVGLIGQDGSFSQYSLNYHRVMLDTFSMVEVWRRHMGLPDFSAGSLRRLQAATGWLHHMINPINGDGPNVGANDGARLLQLTDTPYRDFRPSVQLAMGLFAGERAYAELGAWDHPLHWLGLPPPQTAAPPAGSRQADDGGFAVLRRGPVMAMLRYPRFRFRPSQADALHLDFWQGGDNLLRDAGTYSYNTQAHWLNYFGGTAGHNTVQFDEQDQMPRLGRFLFGDWLKTLRMEPLREDAAAASFAAGYRDSQGASHLRRVSLGVAHLRVVDEIAGFARKAVLRWRLAPGRWTLEGCRLTDGVQTLTVQASMPVVRCELVEGWESRQYLEKTALPVLEVEVQEPGVLTTDYRWAV
jgi:hypothetical protein